jgi:hypothetical protein
MIQQESYRKVYPDELSAIVVRVLDGAGVPPENRTSEGVARLAEVIHKDLQYIGQMEDDYNKILNQLGESG